jgi:hypothetical protein
VITHKDFLFFRSITLSEPVIHDESAKAEVIFKKIDGTTSQFTLQLRYDCDLDESALPFLRMAFIMPLMNYGLFTEKFDLLFSLSHADYNLVEQLNRIFSRDIYVNKILRRRTNYILPEFLPDQNQIKVSDAEPRAIIHAETITEDKIISSSLESNKCGILSSGGKESLLTYGLLKEIGAEVYPMYITESGGHWRTARTAYEYHKQTDDHTGKVWTNVDRFYNFMLDNLSFIRKDHREVRADTYPIRLCIFPFYIFSLLPVFTKHHIGNLLLGSEFDDQRETPMYQGIQHYYGIYDQHQDYDILMNDWYEKRVPFMKQWSAVRGISGLIVERILVKRYPHLACLQRSCHSCHLEHDAIVPCGKCTKCLGVMLFLSANHADPKIMNFKKDDLDLFQKRLQTSKLRLDEDEKNHSLYLSNISIDKRIPSPVHHVEQIHVNKDLCNPLLLPTGFQKNIYGLLERYTKGYCILQDGTWLKTEKQKALEGCV